MYHAPDVWLVVRVHSHSATELTKVLNDHHKKGWELFSLVSEEFDYVLVFKLIEDA